LVTLGVQREFDPYLKESDNAVSLLAQWLLYLWLNGLLLIRVGVLARVPPLCTGTFLVIIAFGVVVWTVRHSWSELTEDDDGDRKSSVVEDEVEMQSVATVRDTRSSVRDTNSEWEELTDEVSGEIYYHNMITRETSRYPPDQSQYSASTSSKDSGKRVSVMMPKSDQSETDDLDSPSMSGVFRKAEKSMMFSNNPMHSKRASKKPSSKIVLNEI
jgi:hypothetical protein